MEYGDRSFWKEFINTYRSFECLWNKQDSGYSDKKQRNEAYNVLLDLCKTRYPNSTKKLVAMKIHNFRTAFRREHNKMKQSKKSGSSSTHVPSLWYYKLLTFLTASETPEEAVEVWDMENNDEAEGAYEEDSNVAATSDSPASSGRGTPPGRRMKTFDPRQKECYTLENVTPWDEIKKFAKPEDYCDVTGRKWACDLREMDPQQRVIAEKVISEVMFWGKTGSLDMHDGFQPRVHTQPEAYVREMEDADDAVEHEDDQLIMEKERMLITKKER